jgi:hypothetical protein
VWLSEGRALYDELGPGFTLLDFGNAKDAAAFADAARTRGIPLKVLPLTPIQPYDTRLVLVRPDQHIAWHGDNVTDAGAVLDRARGA